MFVFFGKSGVLAFDREGRQLWQKSVGTGSAMMGWGSGASLLAYKNLVLVNANAESESLVALDQRTGREVWKAEPRRQPKPPAAALEPVPVLRWGSRGRGPGRHRRPVSKPRHIKISPRTVDPTRKPAV